jgi:thiazole synthase
MEFKIGGKTLNSRFFIGSGKLPTYAILPEMIEKSGVEVITVAVRRINPEAQHENILDYIPGHCVIMVNTSGATTAAEAVKIARIGRELTGSDWIKIEVETDAKYLLPDNEETLKAAEILVAEGFQVFPYISPDLVMAKKLERAGVAAVMPLAAPIGTNKGITCAALLRPIIREITIPVIIDAGIGRPSHAAEAMELGADAVLANTAIATARNPVLMAMAMAKAVEAGRMAYEMGLLAEKEYAEASSPLTGFLRSAG